jgi:hypothetical protein
MPLIDTHAAVLTVHPSQSNPAVSRIEVQVRPGDPGTVSLRYSLTADMAHVRMPPAGTGARVDGLWRHTCFEAFVAPAGGSSYHEFNFSPSLDWAMYRFNAYREGMSPVVVARAPEISLKRLDQGFELRASVSVDDMADLRGAGPLRIALAAVIEDENGRLSYWGLRHPPGKPDFHHPDGFALEVTRS